MVSKSKRARLAPARNLSKTCLNWAIAVFVFKLMIIFSIQGGNIEISGRPFFLDGIWLGSDGENYLTGYDGLLAEGVFSKSGILNYFPAGYPLVIFLISVLGKSWALTTLSILQSAIFSFSVYFFASQLIKTRLTKYSYLVFIIIILNPTLSLTSIWLGYENLTASGFLIAAGLIVKDLVEKSDSNFTRYLLINSIVFGFLSFLQPRLIVSGVLINLYWIVLRKGVKAGSLLMIFALVVPLLFPATLIYRNNRATGINSISTNLGVTMNIGAGDTATGGYMNSGFGVPCKLTGTPSQQDNQRVKCVLDWYASNPGKAVKLFYNKSVYFWSPWFGPVGNGTMSRNPWIGISPIRDMHQGLVEPKVVYGAIGKSISWIWLISSMLLMLYGYLILRRQKSVERVIGNIAMVIISINWIISLFSIGDHRFRVPIMGLSLFLQAIGLKTLFKGGKATMVDGPSLR